MAPFTVIYGEHTALRGFQPAKTSSSASSSFLMGALMHMRGSLSRFEPKREPRREILGSAAAAAFLMRRVRIER